MFLFSLCFKSLLSLIFSQFHHFLFSRSCFHFDQVKKNKEVLPMQERKQTNDFKLESSIEVLIKLFSRHSNASLDTFYIAIRLSPLDNSSFDISIMHKSYQSTLPSANRLLQKKWDDKYYAEHRILVINSSFGFPLDIRWEYLLGSRCSTKYWYTSTSDFYAFTFEIEETSSLLIFYEEAITPHPSL